MKKLICARVLAFALCLPASFAMLTGCADPTFALSRGLVTGSCITATTGSLSVTNASGTVFAKQAETVRFCPPAIVPDVAPISPPPAASAAST